MSSQQSQLQDMLSTAYQNATNLVDPWNMLTAVNSGGSSSHSSEADTASLEDANSNTDSLDVAVGSSPAADFIPAGMIRLCANNETQYDLLLLDHTKMIIGREAQCELPIVSMEISRQHAMVTYEQNQWWIVDLSSTNGLWVNSERVEACPRGFNPINYRIRLVHGSNICFGPPEQATFEYMFVENYRHYMQWVAAGGTFTKFQEKFYRMHSLSSGNNSSQSTVVDINGPTQPLPEGKPSWLANINDSHRLGSSEIEQIRQEVRHWQFQCHKQSDQIRNMTTQLKMLRKQLAENEHKAFKEKRNYESLLQKHKTLNAQLEANLHANRTATNAFVNDSDSFRLVAQKCMDELTCSICSEYFIEPVVLGCGHTFCASCIDQWRAEFRNQFNFSSHGICPICRKEIESTTNEIILQNVINFHLELLLSKVDTEERKKLIETRKAAPRRFNPSNSRHNLQDILISLTESNNIRYQRIFDSMENIRQRYQWPSTMNQRSSELGSFFPLDSRPHQQPSSTQVVTEHQQERVQDRPINLNWLSPVNEENDDDVVLIGEVAFNGNHPPSAVAPRVQSPPTSPRFSPVFSPFTLSSSSSLTSDSSSSPDLFLSSFDESPPNVELVSMPNSNENSLAARREEETTNDDTIMRGVRRFRALELDNDPSFNTMASSSYMFDHSSVVRPVKRRRQDLQAVRSILQPSVPEIIEIESD